jgi:micrococcal nuclease
MRILYIISILYFVLGCNHPESIEYDRDNGNRTASSNDYKSLELETDSENGYKVVGIKDGDTFVVLMNGIEQVVRFAHIDCPEKRQPYGTNAKQFVSEKCFGKYVNLVHQNKFDRNRRLIAEVILTDGSNLNKELVKNGLAWHFKKYSQENSYADLEDDARKLRVGLWSDSNPIAPWTWRK